MLAAVKSSTAQRGEEKISFLDASAPGAWPITDATYILIERTPKSPKHASRVLQFFYWAFLRGDSMASETGYVPLPPNVQARAVGILGQVRDQQGNPLNFMTGVGVDDVML